MTIQARVRAHSGAHRGVRRVIRPMAGQCFEIELSPVGGRWLIRIPEIDAVTEAAARTEVEAAARDCIATRSGIPLGYISVWVRD